MASVLLSPSPCCHPGTCERVGEGPEREPERRECLGPRQRPSRDWGFTRYPGRH